MCLAESGQGKEGRWRVFRPWGRPQGIQYRAVQTAAALFSSLSCDLEQSTAPSRASGSFHGSEPPFYSLNVTGVGEEQSGAVTGRLEKGLSLFHPHPQRKVRQGCSCPYWMGGEVQGVKESLHSVMKQVFIVHL